MPGHNRGATDVNQPRVEELKTSVSRPENESDNFKTVIVKTSVPSKWSLLKDSEFSQMDARHLSAQTPLRLETEKKTRIQSEVPKTASNDRNPRFQKPMYHNVGDSRRLNSSSQKGSLE